MKYFTPELWSKFNSDSVEDHEQADIEWNKNIEEYRAVFETIQTRFSKKFLDIYKRNYGFHDYRIKNIALTHKKIGEKNPVSIEITISDYENTYKLTYKRVSKFYVNYEDSGSGPWSNRVGFEDWGYSEFLPVDCDTLSHEILFSLGASIIIHFKNGNIFINKVKD